MHIIVATPGRLIDLMERGTVSLSTVRNVVLDEADEMLNMGFSESLNAILADVPQDRNTILFSATMSREIKRIVDFYPEIYGIIFCRTKIETQEIADKLMQEGYNADSLHGDLSQIQRDLEKVKVNDAEIEEFMTEIYRKLDWLSKEDLIKRVVSREFSRFFEYYNGRADMERTARDCGSNFRGSSPGGV